MNAQDLINEVEIENKKSSVDKIMRDYYPDYFLEKKTDENITIILTKLKQGGMKCLKKIQ